MTDQAKRQAIEACGTCGQPEGAGDATPQDFRVRLAEPLTRRPVTPGPAELAGNPRSRSAKLRAIKKLPPQTP